MLHVYRNTPHGREALLTSALFCQQTGASLSVYLPRWNQFLMYFDDAIATIALDKAFLASHETARERATATLAGQGVEFSFLEPEAFTTRQLPNLPTDWTYMCCPRAIGKLSAKIRLGYIGPSARHIIRHAPFPVLLPQPAAKPWRSVVCFFGGSPHAVKALRCAVDISRHKRLPLKVFTYGDGRPRSHYEGRLRAEKLAGAVRGRKWIFHRGGKFGETLLDVPHDALVVAGAYGHGVARGLLFGSRLEKIQAALPNPLLVVGPKVQMAHASAAARSAAA